MQNPTHPQVSIIVPAYNAEAYIEECLDSLCAQTLADLEILVVNDGSTDDTANILRYREEHDPRIRVFHELNSGPGTARNVGLEHATADVLMFCDADDTLAPTCCAQVAAALAHSQADLCVFGFDLVPPELAHPSLKGKTQPKAGTYELPRQLRELLFHAQARPFAARMALTRSFVEATHVRFDPELTLADDQFFCFATMARARRAILLADELYHYRMTSGSLTHATEKNKTPEAQLQHLAAKTTAHLRALEAVIEDGKVTVLLGSKRSADEVGLPESEQVTLQAELLQFCLELMLFDASKLDSERRRELWQTWLNIVAPLVEKPQVVAGLSKAARACVADVQKVCSGELDGVTRAHLIGYYYEQRGLVASVKRLLWRG